VKTDKAKQEYEQKLKDFPKMLFDIQALMDLGKSKGKVSPKVIVEKCISLIEYQLPADIEKSIFYEPVEDENKEYKEKIKKLVTTVVYPAYKNFQSYLKNTYLPAAKDMPGIGHLPQGMKYYENKVKFYTTLDMTPDDVFKKGEEEVARIKAEMTEIVKKLKFEGDFDAFVQFLRKDPQFYANSPQQLLHYAAWLSKSIEEKLPKYFGNLPRNPFTVKEVPSGLAPNYTSGRYSPGSYTRNKAGEYWVNTFNLKSRPLYAMPALTLHEAVPGHHLQGSLAQEITGMSDFRRSTYLSAFGEGWALYTEYLGKEMGIYETPYDDFGRLTYEMWRACRLVIDVGLHYKSWTRDQAIQFMSSNTALSNLEIENEIDRYIGWPGQAISYKTGEIVIRRMRKELEAQLGDKFDLRKFHDVTLKNGAMTLRMLEKVVKGEMATKS
jgi:uncharacterized protein (DUF885 family)